jgi:O-antigen/teichoic acid export membrane protein
MIHELPGKGFFREAFWVGFGLLSSILALLVGTRFLTSLLSTTEYGKLALAVSLATLAVQICGNPIGQTATRFYSNWCVAGKLKALILNLRNSLAWAIGGIVFASLMVVVAGNYFDGFPTPYFNLTAGFFAILLVANRVAFGLEDAARERRFRGIVQGFFEVSRFLFAIGFFFLLDETNAQTALSGFVVAALLTVAIHGFFLHKVFEKSTGGQEACKIMVTPADITGLRHFQIPLIISNGCIWVVMMAERWALTQCGNMSDVGGYSAVYQLAFVPMLFVSTFLVLLTEPVIYQRVGLDNKKKSHALLVNSYVAISIFFITLIFFGVLYFYHSLVGSFFLGAEFRSYSWMFPWLLLAGGCFAVAQQLLLKLSCEMRTGKLAGLWGMIAIIAIVFYSIGANYWQLKGILTAVVGVNGLLLIFAITLPHMGKRMTVSL